MPQVGVRCEFGLAQSVVRHRVAEVLTGPLEYGIRERPEVIEGQPMALYQGAVVLRC